MSVNAMIRGAAEERSPYNCRVSALISGVAYWRVRDLSHSLLRVRHSASCGCRYSQPSATVTLSTNAELELWAYRLVLTFREKRNGGL